MLALGQYRELVCPGCRGWLPETTARESEGAYHVKAPIRCHRCTAYGHASDKAKDMSHPESLLLQVTPRR